MNLTNVWEFEKTLPILEKLTCLTDKYTNLTKKFTNLKIVHWYEKNHGFEKFTIKKTKNENEKEKIK